jgi:hypothetical protein
MDTDQHAKFYPVIDWNGDAYIYRNGHLYTLINADLRSDRDAIINALINVDGNEYTVYDPISNRYRDPYLDAGAYTDQHADL